MSYYHELQDQLRFIRSIDRVTEEAKKLQNMKDRAGLYQVLMLELLDGNYHNDTAKIEFYREIEDWARVNAENIKKSA